MAIDQNDLKELVKQLVKAVKEGQNNEGQEIEIKGNETPQELAEKFKTISSIRAQYENIAKIRKDHVTVEGTLTKEGSIQVADQARMMEQAGIISSHYSQRLEQLAAMAETSAEARHELEEQQKLIKEGLDNWEKTIKYVKEYHEKIEKALGVSVDVFKDLALSADKAGKGLQSATGFTQDFRDSMLQINKAAIDSGVSISDASVALTGMANNLSSFDPLAKKSNETLATQIALLGKLGVDANTAAKSVDFLERSMNMSRDAAANMTMDLATFADGMGVTSGKMMSDFQAVSGTLAMQGKDMVKTFKNIAAQAKATGIEVSQLVSIAQRFNTFSDAADNVAKLNAVLGTQMSTIELMGMKQDERIDHLRDQVQMTVGDFNNLDMYTQQFIANAMGFKDVGEAGRFLNMSAQEQDEYRQRAEESAKTQEEIAKITQDFIPIMERLQLSMAKAALALKPIIDAFMMFFDAVFALDEMMGNELLPTLAMAILLYKGLSFILPMVTLMYNAQSKALQLSVWWTNLQSKAMAFLNSQMFAVMIVAGLLAVIFNSDMPRALRVVTSGVLALGLALKFGFGWWSALASVVAVMITLFSTRINPLFVNVFAHMAIGVALLAVAFQFVSTKAMIAAAVLGLMFGAFAYFFGEMKGAGENLLSLSLGFVALGVALALVGALFSNPMVMLGAAIFTGLMLGLAAAIAIMGSGIESMGAGFEKMVESLKSVKGIMAELDGVVTNSFIAVTQEGGATRAIIANGDGLSGVLAGSVKVDVNIPKIQSPEVNVKVFLDGAELRSIIKSVMGEVK